MISIHNTGLITDSLQVREFLKKDKTRTKVAYQFKEIGEMDHCYKVRFGKEFIFDGDNREIVLPREVYSDNELAYFLRVSVELISLTQGYLPLHAGLVNSLQSSFLFFGKTRSGKSSLVDFLSNKGGFNAVCDDHLILSDGKGIGNDRTRIRRKNNEDEYRSIPLNSGEIIAPKGFWIEFSETERSFERIDPETFFSDPSKIREILRYLFKDVTCQDQVFSIDSLLKRRGTIEKAERDLCDFLEKYSAEMYYGVGDKTFIGEEILKL